MNIWAIIWLILMVVFLIMEAATVQLISTWFAVGALAALDFDRAFVLFHSLFFPGKSNWLFDWRTDPIILALPQEFFRNCAILIGAGLVIFSLSLLIFTGIRDKKAGK